jgi:hypothetical protein
MRRRVSHVTAILLHVSGHEEGSLDVPPPSIAALKACLRCRDVGQLVRFVNPGGWKEPPTVVLLGRFDDLDVKALLDMFWAQEWRVPEQVVLVVTTKDEASRVYRPSAGS